MEGRFRRLHEAARRTAALHRLAVISRILLALAFVPTALVKVQGKRFTSISVQEPIGYFFEALYQSGFYWRFLGLSQLVAGALLLIPSTSTLGAVLFLPIILNIFVITVSLHFTGTPVITGLMLLASLFLVCWDYHRLAAIVWGARGGYEVPASPVFPGIERAGYALGASAAMVLLFSARGLAVGGPMRVMLVSAVGAAVLACLMVIAGWRIAAGGPLRT
ncbi:MAG: hypothetical protein IT355_01810 [Gemmatimonadaceae bacterium]|nr:hypothetical protein [Gemmatimonadaceae bacterium]